MPGNTCTGRREQEYQPLGTEVPAGWEQMTLCNRIEQADTRKKATSRFPGL